MTNQIYKYIYTIIVLSTFIVAMFTSRTDHAIYIYIII